VGNDRRQLGMMQFIGRGNVMNPQRSVSWWQRLRSSFVAATMASMALSSTNPLGTKAVAETQPSGRARQDKSPKPVLDRYGDPLPLQAFARLGTVRFRQSGLQQVLFHPEGNVLATIGHERAVILWNLINGKRVGSIAEHSASILCAAFARDGKVLASADYDGNLLLTDYATGKTVRSLKVPKHLTGIGSTSENILLLDTVHWKKVRTLSGGGFRFHFSPDARHIVAIGEHLTWWDVEAGKRLHQFKQEKDFFYGVALHPKKMLAVTGSASGYFKIWDLDAGKLVKKCATPQTYVSGAAFSADGSKLVTRSHDSLEIWDTATWERITGFDGPAIHAYLIAFTPDGKQLVSLHNDTPHYQIRRWDVANAKEVSCVVRHDGGLFRQQAFSGDGKYLVGWKGESSFDTKKRTLLRVWDTQSGKECSAFEYWGEFAVSRENHRLAALSSRDRFSFWDMTTGNMVQSFAITPDPADQAEEPRRVDQPKSRAVFSRPIDVGSMALSPRADWLAAVEGNQDIPASIAIWNAATGRRERKFGSLKKNSEGPSLQMSLRKLDFFPIGQSLADGVSEERFSLQGAREEGFSRIEVWEPFTGMSRRRLAELSEALTSFTISPDGKVIASAYRNGSIRFWDVASGNQLAHFEGIKSGVVSLAFSPDGKMLGSTAFDTTILLWKAPQAPKLGTLRQRELERCWADLNGNDAKTAFSAILALADNPTQAVPFLAAKLRDHPAAKLEQVKKNMADLDDEVFAVREQAFQKLLRMGRWIRPSLNHAMQAPPSVEALRRMELLMTKLNESKVDPEELRIQRVTETLQIIGTPPAQELLKRFLAS
jgi:WD40 repeat protein